MHCAHCSQLMGHAPTSGAAVATYGDAVRRIVPSVVGFLSAEFALPRSSPE